MPSSSGSSIYGSYRTTDQRDPGDVISDPSPTTPSTTAAVHRFEHPTADMTSIHRHTRKHFRRSPSRIQQWVLDQQRLQQVAQDTPPASPDSSEPPAPSSGCHPYLAYPHLNTHTVTKGNKKIDSSADCFVVVEETDLFVRPGRDAYNSTKTLRSVLPSTPTTPRKKPGIAHSPTAGNGSSSPLRSFHLSFSHARKPSGTTASITTRSPSPSRSSIFRRPGTIDTQTSYTQHSNLTSPLFSPKPSPAISGEFGSLTHASGSSTWKLKRPTVLGHFLAPSEGQTDDAPIHRPSTSSTFTHSSSATFTQPSTDTLNTPVKLNSGRSHSPASFFRSSNSLWSLPAQATHIHDPPHSTKVIARDHDSDKSTFRNSIKTHSGSSALHLLSSPKKRKKRKLIISGIPAGDQSRFEAVRRWCESFGEVNQITRVQNGDLHIDFRKNEVADTVCRLHARVFIGGVGSVGLSWFTGKRP